MSVVAVFYSDPFETKLEKWVFSKGTDREGALEGLKPASSSCSARANGTVRIFRATVINMIHVVVTLWQVTV